MADVIDFDSYKHQKTPVYQAGLPVMKAYENLGDYLAMEGATPADILDALDALNEAITGEGERLKG